MHDVRTSLPLENWIKHCLLRNNGQKNEAYRDLLKTGIEQRWYEDKDLCQWLIQMKESYVERQKQVFANTWK